jgi:2-amino-4-hydroxy-6-hydroxymethyldihydropteridine diphosphokinase
MIIISLGSNVTSRWGNTAITILTALKCLTRHKVHVLRRSSLYRTAPYGPIRQPNFINAVALIRTSLPPLALLSLFKTIETKAGRIPSMRRWGPRPLDIDILDYKRLIINWAIPNRQAFKCKQLTLILPHPGIASRAFVLRPLSEIMPFWHHPVSGLTAAQMLKRLGPAQMGRILEAIDGDLSPSAKQQSLNMEEKIAI